MNTPGNLNSNPKRKPTTRRKNNLILIAIVLLIATGLALSALSNPGVRVVSPFRSARDTSLPTTPRTADRPVAAQESIARGTEVLSTTARVPGSPAAGRHAVGDKLLPNPVPRPKRALGVVSAAEPMTSSSTLGANLFSTPPRVLDARVALPHEGYDPRTEGEQW
jgi:hypothetical protein